MAGVGDGMRDSRQCPNHIAGFNFNNRRGWRRQRRGFVVVVVDYDDVVRLDGAQVPAQRSMAAMVQP